MVEFNDRRLGRHASPEYGALSPEQKAAYTANYRQGWRHSSTAVNPDLDKNPHVSDPQSSKAWEDGYMDHAVGRDKYALRGHRFGTGDPVEGY